MDSRIRISLDTNLWSYIGDEAQSSAFEALVADRNLQVVVPPSTLLEVLRIPVADPRRRIIAALSGRDHHRLASEAQLESQEVVAEARRLRPAWCRSMPDTAKLASLTAAWTKRIWRIARSQPEVLHEYLTRDLRIHDYVTQKQREQRLEVIRTGFDVTSVSTLKASATSDASPEYLAGWDGAPVDVWRLHTRDLFWHQLATVPARAWLTGDDTTYADWTGAWLDLGCLTSDRSDFTRFWLQEVEVTAIPRNWLRWAVPTVQIARKVTGGNPADAQHSAYLLDCDTYLTADVGYAATLAMVREQAPFTMAEPRLVRYDPKMSIVDAIASAL